MKVCKFGGSSLADAARVGKVCDIVASDPKRRIVVVSAPGKRRPGDTKITDLLIACANHRTGHGGSDALDRIVARFERIRKDLGLPPGIVKDIAGDLNERLSADTKHRERFMDSVKAAGEDNCAKLVAAALRKRGVDAHYVSPREAGLLLSSEYGNAQILAESHNNLAALRARKGVTVFPGFFGYSREGEVVTFPRGGSDITGAILAAAVNAKIYENFTDVDFVYAVNPRIVPGVRPISELTYREMRELSYAGFGVLHEEAIMPLVRAGIPICIRNTNFPDAPGTRIVPERVPKHGQIAGIAAKSGFCIVYLSKYLMNREVGFGRRLLLIFEDEGMSFEHLPSGIDNLSVVLKEDGFDAETEKRVLRRIRDELKVDNTYVERGLALIMLAGEGMRHTLGLAARATQALRAARVNIEMLDQGASEISMMFGVKAKDKDRAVLSLYKAFFRKRKL